MLTSNWETLYSITNIYEANHWMEETLRTILQSECPISKMQSNKKLKNWADSETLELFKKIDLARKKAKNTDDENYWSEYKKLKNAATKKMRQN